MKTEKELLDSANIRKLRTVVSRKALYEDEEQQVLSWFMEHRQAKLAITGVAIQNQMRFLVEIEHPEILNKFKAMDG